MRGQEHSCIFSSWYSIWNVPRFTSKNANAVTKILSLAFKDAHPKKMSMLLEINKNFQLFLSFLSQKLRKFELLDSCKTIRTSKNVEGISNFLFMILNSNLDWFLKSIKDSKFIENMHLKSKKSITVTSRFSQLFESREKVD